jgi:hypothetical protein
MAPPGPPGGAEPCTVCGSRTCKAFPDIDVHPRYPFLSEAHKARPPEVEPQRPKGKRRPVEDRARHLEEDR